MKRVGLFEAKTKLSSLVDLVEQGEEITITRHGRPVARLIAASPRPSKKEIEAMIRRVRTLRRRVAMKQSDVLEIIEEGRRR